MGTPVIVAAARTAIGTAHRGSLTGVDAWRLAELTVAEALERSGLEPTDVDDLVLGESLQGGGNLARHAAVVLGMTSIPGAAVNRHCASGMAAVQMGAASIAAGMDDVVIVGGVESLSHMPRFLKSTVPPDGQYHPWMPPSHPDRPDAPNLNMSITVGDNTARAVGIDRPTLDAWAYRSHQRALAAIDEGRFAEEIFPIEVPGRDGKPMTFAVDEHPRRTTTLEKLAALPLLNPTMEGAVTTAGSSSGINDGGCALVLADEQWAKDRGLRPLGAIRAWASVGVDPALTGLGPVGAIPKALKRAGLGVRDIDLIEINEAFASVPVAACRRLELDEERVNVNGSGCSLGHPVGATGARMIVTTLFEMRRRELRRGLASLCAGGGMGQAIVFEAR